jgi:hypothetical protein
MRTRSRRQDGWAVAGTLAFLVGVPSLAQAQQSGLFPLAPIQRQRTPCPLEDPVYRMYRQQYFGYHPTCWRRFPPGWGCPSPEAPNPAASFREIPRDKPPADLGTDGQPPLDGQPQPGPGEMEPGPGGPRNPQNPNNLPPLPPGDRSPFDLDTRPGTPPAGAALPGDRDPARATPGASGAAGLGNDQPQPPPVNVPATPSGPGVSASPNSLQGDGPALALPDPTTSAPAPSAVPAVGLTTVPPQTYARPVQAPKRQSFLTNLFGGVMRR